jgi:16S rRNA (cytidine1402-2'-O)-methyltransferase
MLYLVATPIGNLADITFRAIEILKSCDYILCEDTRHSIVLLKHYQISKPLKSFHKFNEAQQEGKILEDLQAGVNIALISDAGTPGISDPGTRLVKICRTQKIPVTSIPGPCAATIALSASGFDTSCFQFLGFLPRKAGELKGVLQNILMYSGTSICYESPNRVENAIKILIQLAPTRQIIVARELTKKFEEFIQGTPEELLNSHKKKPFRGELVLLIEGIQKNDLPDWLSLSPQEHVAFVEHNYSLTHQEAIKMAAEQRGVPKRNIYNALLK